MRYVIGCLVGVVLLTGCGEKSDRDFGHLVELYRKEGKWSEAISVLQRQLQVTPNNPELNRMAGVVFRQRGNLLEAERYLRRALEIDASNAATLQELGSLYFDQGKYPEALEHFDRSIIIKRKSREKISDLLMAMARTLRILAEGDTREQEEKIIDYAREAVEVDPGNGEARRLYAELLLERGNADAAIAQLEEARKLQPDLIDIRRDLGLLYQFAKKDTERAVRYFRYCLTNRQEQPSPGEREQMGYLLSLAEGKRRNNGSSQRYRRTYWKAKISCPLTRFHLPCRGQEDCELDRLILWGGEHLIESKRVPVDLTRNQWQEGFWMAVRPWCEALPEREVVRLTEFSESDLGKIARFHRRRAAEALAEGKRIRTLEHFQDGIALLEGNGLKIVAARHAITKEWEDIWRARKRAENWYENRNNPPPKEEPAPYLERSYEECIRNYRSLSDFVASQNQALLWEEVVSLYREAGTFADREMGDWPLALDWYQRYLARVAELEDIPDLEKTLIQHRVEALRRVLAPPPAASPVKPTLEPASR